LTQEISCCLRKYVTTNGDVLIDSNKQFNLPITRILSLSLPPTNANSYGYGIGTTMLTAPNTNFSFINGKTVRWRFKYDAIASLFTVAGNARFTGVGSAASANDLRITADGTLTTNTSDARLKENLVAIDGSSTLEKIMTLKPYYYDWKDDPDAPRDLGFLAQDMEKVFPDVVFTNPTDGYMGINYSRLPALIIASLQEMNKR